MSQSFRQHHKKNGTVDRDNRATVIKTVKMPRFAQALEFADGGFLQGTFWA
jgi:hypothetical protein